MILSHARKFIYIKGRKVAGTSIEIALSRICGPDDVITPITPRDERQRLQSGRPSQNYSRSRLEEATYLKNVARKDPAAAPPEQLFYNHMPLQEVENTCRADLRGYTIICAERNPYAKILSFINREITSKQYRQGGSLCASDADIQRMTDHYLVTGDILHVYNLPLYSSQQRPEPDIILRFEHLAEDFALLLRRISPGADISLPHAKKGKGFTPEDAARIFRKDQLRELNNLFHNEFSTFGYDFLE